MKNFTPFQCIPVLLGLLLLVACNSNQSKIGYVLTQKLFDGFTGSKEAQQQMNRLQLKQKAILDSLTLRIQTISDPTQDADQQKYNRISQEFAQANQQQLQQQSEALWKQINQYLSEYGRQNGYQFIYGANGSGNLMYADSTLDITQSLLTFINSKYAGN